MKRIYLIFLFILTSSILQAQIIQFTEVCYDPSGDTTVTGALLGDTNGDGVYNQSEDEFLELYSFSNINLDVSGYQVVDDTATGNVVYTIPNGTIIPAGGVLVIFGGGTPVGNFGGATVVADTSGLSLDNTGEVIAIRDSSGVDVLYFNSDALDDDPNESYTRDYVAPLNFFRHSTLDSALFSPGVNVDGTPFNTFIFVSRIELSGMGGTDTIKTLGGTLLIADSIYPASATNKKLSWSVFFNFGVTSPVASIDTNGVLTALTNGTVYVVGTATDGYGASRTIQIEVINQSTSISKQEVAKNLSVFPNPVKNRLTINSIIPFDEADIYSITGKKLKVREIGFNQYSTESLDAGIYYLRLTNGKEIFTVRFVKQ